MKYGEFFRSARKDKNITLRQLSEITNISFSQLGKIEREEHRPTKENTIKIANALEIKTAFALQLLGYTGDTTATDNIDPLVRYKVIVRDGLTCRLCGAQAPAVTLHADLIVPKEFGGTPIIDNIVSLCEECLKGRASFIYKEGLNQDILYNKYKIRFSLRHN